MSSEDTKDVLKAEGKGEQHIKRSTPLKKLMEAYCKRQGLSQASVRFVFDGNRVQGTETADSLEMDDQDVIDVLVEQTGGF